MKTYNIIITGKPVVLKNSKRIVTTYGRRLIISSKRVLERQEMAIYEAKKQWDNAPTITGAISLKILSCGTWMHGDGNVPDASNLYQFPEDILEAAKIIKNDNQVVHHDGSRRVYLCEACEHKQWMPRKKQYKKCGNVTDCKREQVVITIKPYYIKINPNNVEFSFNQETCEFENISDKQIEIWKNTYPDVNIRGEVLRAGLWLCEHTNKLYKNYHRFLLNWFSRNQSNVGKKKNKSLQINNVLDEL